VVALHLKGSQKTTARASRSRVCPVMAARPTQPSPQPAVARIGSRLEVKSYPWSGTGRPTARYAASAVLIWGARMRWGLSGKRGKVVFAWDPKRSFRRRAAGGAVSVGQATGAGLLLFCRLAWPGVEAGRGVGGCGTVIYGL